MYGNVNRAINMDYEREHRFHWFYYSVAAIRGSGMEMKSTLNRSSKRDEDFVS